MPQLIEFFVPIEPVGKGRPIVCRNGHAFTPAKTRNAEQEIRAFFLDKYKNFEPLQGALEVWIEFIIIRPKSRKKELHCVTKPDLDNSIKLVLDSLNKYAYIDDKQVVVLHAGKRYSELNNAFGISVKIKELEC